MTHDHEAEARAEAAERARDATQAELVEALRFYAREWQSNWQGDPNVPGGTQDWREPTDALWEDEGNRARVLLARIDGRDA